MKLELEATVNRHNEEVKELEALKSKEIEAVEAQISMLKEELSTLKLNNADLAADYAVLEARASSDAVGMLQQQQLERKEARQHSAMSLMRRVLSRIGRRKEQNALCDFRRRYDAYLVQATEESMRNSAVKIMKGAVFRWLKGMPRLYVQIWRSNQRKQAEIGSKLEQASLLSTIDKATESLNQEIHDLNLKIKLVEDEKNRLEASLEQARSHWEKGVVELKMARDNTDFLEIVNRYTCSASLHTWLIHVPPHAVT